MKKYAFIGVFIILGLTLALASDFGFTDSTKPNLESSRTPATNINNSYYNLSFYNVTGGNVSGGGQTGQLAYWVNDRNVSGISTSYFDGTFASFNQTYLLYGDRVNNIFSVLAPSGSQLWYDNNVNDYGLEQFQLGSNLKLRYYHTYDIDNIIPNYTIGDSGEPINIISYGNFTTQCVTFKDGSTQCTASSGSGSTYNATYHKTSADVTANRSQWFLNNTNMIYSNITAVSQNIHRLNGSLVETRGSGSGINMWNDGELAMYGTFPHFFLNESDCPFGICVNSYFMLDGNRFQIQSYSATKSYITTVFDMNMRPTFPVFASDYTGRVAIGGGGSGGVKGVLTLNSSKSYAPQLVLDNSTVATTRYRGAIERVNSDLVFTQEDLNHTRLLMVRNVTGGTQMYPCSLATEGQYGYNFTLHKPLVCNSTDWVVLY